MKNIGVGALASWRMRELGTAKSLGSAGNGSRERTVELLSVTIPIKHTPAEDRVMFE